jgi:hypothetical protein
MPNTHRLTGRFFSVLISLTFALLLPRFATADHSPTLCQISDTVYRADGKPAQGTVVILWPEFTTAAGEPIAAGSLTVQLGQQGQFNAALAPNSGATPAGTYYRVTYKLSDDATQPAWRGEYQAISDWLGAQDVMPGDAVQVIAPSRDAMFGAIVREVDLEVVSLRDDRLEYTIKFANEAADPLSYELDNMELPASNSVVFELNTPSTALFIAPLTNAQITNVIASELTIDAGAAPPHGGGIEVRRSDGGWGPSDSGNLAGRFTTQTFTLPRLSRVQGYYLRQYDGSTPPKYSRYSMLLHVDYPL